MARPFARNGAGVLRGEGVRHKSLWSRGGARRRHGGSADEEIGKRKELTCGDGFFRQRWRRDLVVRWRHRVSPEEGMWRYICCHGGLILFPRARICACDGGAGGFVWRHGERRWGSCAPLSYLRRCWRCDGGGAAGGDARASASTYEVWRCCGGRTAFGGSPAGGLAPPWWWGHGDQVLL